MDGELLPFSPLSSASPHSSPLTFSPITTLILFRSGCPARIAMPHLKVQHYAKDLFIHLSHLVHNLCLPPQPQSTVSYDEISPFQDRFNDFHCSLRHSSNFLLPHFPTFPLIISISFALLLSRYLLIYLLLYKPLMLSLCLTQPARLMRYMYKSIFLLVFFNSVHSSRYSIIPCCKILRKDDVDE